MFLFLSSFLNVRATRMAHWTEEDETILPVIISFLITHQKRARWKALSTFLFLTKFSLCLCPTIRTVPFSVMDWQAKRKKKKKMIQEDWCFSLSFLFDSFLLLARVSFAAVLHCAQFYASLSRDECFLESHRATDMACLRSAPAEDKQHLSTICCDLSNFLWPLYIFCFIFLIFLSPHLAG